MKFSAAFASAALLGAVAAAPVAELEKRASFPGLNAAQTKNANAIIGEVKAEGLGAHACQTAIATALQETQIQIYANPVVPASMNYPHDQTGGDQDSVGIFQQRPEWYPDIAADMDAAKSTGLFLKAMKAIPNWQNIDVGTLCQKVQISDFPDRYAKQVPQATSICSAAGLS